MTTDVIVRSFGGEPVALVAIDRSDKLVYVANPNSLSRVESGLTEPVGVPIDDAFEYDMSLYQELRKRWESGDREVWSEMSLIPVRG